MGELGKQELRLSWSLWAELGMEGSGSWSQKMGQIGNKDGVYHTGLSKKVGLAGEFTSSCCDCPCVS